MIFMFSLTPFRRDITLFNDFFNDVFLTSTTNTFNVDIKDRNDKYVVEAELPGIAKEDIKLKVEDSVLTINVNSKKEKKVEKDNYIRRERNEKSYSRSFKFDDIDESLIKAKHENGILIIYLPKISKKINNKDIIIE